MCENQGKLTLAKALPQPRASREDGQPREEEFLGQATSLEKLRRNPRAPSQGDVPQFAKVTRMKGNGLS